jgi:hypothetical protein
VRFFQIGAGSGGTANINKRDKFDKMGDSKSDAGNGLYWNSDVDMKRYILMCNA